MKKIIFIFIFIICFLIPSLAKPLNIAILWHQHQPDYKDSETGIYKAPWVRLHAIKDYYDMASITQQYPSLRLNINLVPSLLKQIDDYNFNNAEDTFTLLMKKDPEYLSLEEKKYILERSFDINWNNVIKKYPYYYSLLKKRGEDGKVTDEIIKKFEDQEYRDLLMWFNLAWMDPDFHPELSDLYEKEKNYLKSDIEKILGFQSGIMKSIIPLHRRLQEEGRIEITTTPFYHPILPLVFDSNVAEKSFNGIELPERYNHPEDAYLHVKKSCEYYNSLFGKYPKGMWPGEGSVSSDIIPVFSQSGINYIATDEEVLSKSIDVEFLRDNKGYLHNKELLYKPYIVSRDGYNLNMIFRDRELSDRIGFDYSKISPEEAVEDIKKYLLKIKNDLPHNKDHLISIILDGENAWENYENDAKEFFHTFYSMLENSNDFNTVLISDFINKTDNKGYLEKLWPGSWISADFTTWIGEKEENIAWNYLLKAREMFRKNSEHLTDSDKNKAHELLLKAEGSDWFWWFGKDQESANDKFFDRMFRNTLKKVYSICKQEIPDYLNIPIISFNEDNETLLKSYFTPELDGKKEKRWMEAYCYINPSNSGVMKKSETGFNKVYYTTDNNKIYYLLEFDKNITDERIFYNIDGKSFPIENSRYFLNNKIMEGVIEGKFSKLSFNMKRKNNNIRIPVQKDIDLKYSYRDSLKKIIEKKDIKGDDRGNGKTEYPLGAVFKKGSFDLTDFEILEDKKYYYFTVSTLIMENPWNSPSGISTQVFDIYINVDNDKKKSNMLDGRNTLSKGEWEYALTGEGWDQSLFIREKSEIKKVKAIKCFYDDINNDFVFKVSKEYFKHDISSAEYIVCVLGQDGMANTRIRKVLKKEGEWNFFSEEDNPSNIIDIIGFNELYNSKENGVSFSK